MGYTTSIKALTRVKNFLDQMVATNDKLEWETTDAIKLQMQIREGLAVCVQRAKDEKGEAKEPYATYARLKSKFIIRTGHGRVIAEPRDVVPLEAVRAGMSKLVISDVDDAFGIIGAALQHGSNEIFFPDADESVDLAMLYNWTSKNGYYIIPSGDGVTLTKHDTGGLAWTPDS